MLNRSKKLIVRAAAGLTLGAVALVGPAATAQVAFAAPVKVATAPAKPAPKPVAKPVVKKPVVKKPAPKPVVKKPVAKPAPKAPKIAAAALRQVNRNQDCTMLVTNSLKSVGINYHGWPIGYTKLGPATTKPVPGDLVYYPNGGMGWAHIAVYIGNGKAVHGGWNGYTTKVFSVNVGVGGHKFVHVK